jgi:3,4-dihydroxy 2-butanone 4-phosphate synthase / GTP cyclohydrolase II
MQLSSTEVLVAEIRAGRIVILMDDEDRENEGDLVAAAAHVTPDMINFMAKYGRGLICLTLTQARCHQLSLPPMVSDNRSPMRTAFTVSIEAASGVTTGISAADRARTVQAAVAPNAAPSDLIQPGHVFPLTSQNGGVLTRAGHTEAGCDLAQMAGLESAAVICEILKDDGEMARKADLLEFAERHGLKIGTIADIIHHRIQTERLVEAVARKTINTAHGAFELIAFSDKAFDQVHLALVKGTISKNEETLVRVHERLSVMDFLDQERSAHSFTVQEAMRTIAAAGKGVIVLLNRPELGSDLIARINPRPASTRSAARWDPKRYGIGAQILRDLGVRQMRLMSKVRKLPSLAGFDLEIVGHFTPEDGSQ